MNRNMNLPQIQRIMMEFEKESEIMDMKEEMMSDTIDEAMDEEEDEEEEEAIVNQVLDEIGINLNESVCSHDSSCIHMYDDYVIVWMYTDRHRFAFYSWSPRQVQPSRHREPQAENELHRQRDPLLTMLHCKQDWTTFAENKAHEPIHHSHDASHP
jgi:hypothetical protein